MRKEMMASEEEKQKQERRKRLQDQISQARGGAGQRSLITGQGGGIGYFDETV